MKTAFSLSLASALVLGTLSVAALPASAASRAPVATADLLTPIGWASRTEGKRHVNDLPASYYGYERGVPFEGYGVYGRPAYGYEGAPVPYGYGGDYDDGSY